MFPYTFPFNKPLSKDRNPLKRLVKRIGIPQKSPFEKESLKKALLKRTGIPEKSPFKKDRKPLKQGTEFPVSRDVKQNARLPPQMEPRTEWHPRPVADGNPSL